MTRFANERALFSTTGLTPARFVGPSVRRGHSSRQGSSRASATCSSKPPGARCPGNAVPQRIFDRIAATRAKACHCGYRSDALTWRIRCLFFARRTVAVGRKP